MIGLVIVLAFGLYLVIYMFIRMTQVAKLKEHPHTVLFSSDKPENLFNNKKQFRTLDYTAYCIIDGKKYRARNLFKGIVAGDTLKSFNLRKESYVYGRKLLKYDIKPADMFNKFIVISPRIGDIENFAMSGVFSKPPMLIRKYLGEVFVKKETEDGEDYDIKTTFPLPENIKMEDFTKTLREILSRCKSDKFVATITPELKDEWSGKKTPAKISLYDYAQIVAVIDDIDSQDYH